MPFNLPVANRGAGAPEVEDGLVLLRFDDLQLKDHDDWAGTDKFGHDDNGQRFHFIFTLLTAAREVVYSPITSDGGGDPIELEALTRTATGERSNFYAILSGLLTAQELAAWAAATADDPFDGSAVQGRVVNAKIAHNKANWPFVEAVIGIAAAAKPKTKAEKLAEAQALLAAAEAED